MSGKVATVKPDKEITCEGCKIIACADCELTDKEIEERHEIKSAIINRYEWATASGEGKYTNVPLKLARKIGITESMIVAYIHFRLKISEVAVDGERWVRIPTQMFLRNLPLSKRTLWQGIHCLLCRELIETRTDTQTPYLGQWYLCRHENLLSLVKNRYARIVQLPCEDRTTSLQDSHNSRARIAQRGCRIRTANTRSMKSRKKNK